MSATIDRSGPEHAPGSGAPSNTSGLRYAVIGQLGVGFGVSFGGCLGLAPKLLGGSPCGDQTLLISKLSKGAQR